jgi:hypothetical protein
MQEAVAQRRRIGPASVKDPLKWLYRGVALWLIVNYLRPQDIVKPIGALPLGYIACLIMAIAWFRCKDMEIAKHRFSKLHAAMLVVIALGVANAVNTYWLFQNFVTMATYWVVFFLCLPMLMKSPEYRPKIIRILFLCFGVIGLWVVTHGGHGQGAFLGDENDAALALVVGFGFCFPMRSELKSGAGKIFGIVVLGLCLAGIVVTLSRGGFLGLVAVLFAVAYFSGRILKTLGTILLFAILAIPFVPDKYVAEMNTISDPKESTRVQRLYMWRIGVQQWMSNPIFGVGAGNYPYRVADYEVTEFVQRANIFNRSFAGRSVHSAYFQLLPELGTLGAIIFLLMAGGILKQGLVVGRAAGDKDDIAVRLAQGTAAGMCAFLVAGAFVSVLYYPQFWMLCGLGVAVDSIRGSTQAQPEADSPSKQRARGVSQRKPALPASVPAN